jgi:hypothetical protein
MAAGLHLLDALSMSTKRHGTAEHLRVIPKLPRHEVGDNTVVDVKAAPRREGSIPSLSSRPAKGTMAPPNVIPFTKPRAIAAVAAANPSSMKMTPMPVGSNPSPSAPMTLGPSPRHASPATRVATGWTPPGAVPVVKPTPPQAYVAAAPVARAAPPVAAPMAPPAPVQTLYPMAAPQLRAPAPITSYQAAQPAVYAPAPLPPAPAPLPPAPVSMPAPMSPALAPTAPAYDFHTTTRPAVQMPAQMPAASPVMEPHKKWAVFEALGLGAPKELPQRAAKALVTAYRLLGFGILTIIVVVLVGYIINTMFFYMSDSWVVPMAITATDEKVVTLQSQLAEQQNKRDSIADDLTQAERTIAAQQIFQTEFAKAIKSDLEGRKSALGRIRALASAAGATRAQIKNQNSAFASASRRRMADEYAAGLIDRNAMLSGKFQLAQITSSNLTLAERQAEFETRAAELEAQTRSLDAILANVKGSDVALSYEVLRIKQEYEASLLDLAKSIESRDTLKVSLARQDKILTSLKQSSYLRAINDAASVAFVPYSNLKNVEKGTPLYACKVGMVFCYHVGDVLEVLPGEVQFKHPQRDKMLRGQMVELKLDVENPGAASDDVLFVGGKPLFI